MPRTANLDTAIRNIIASEIKAGLAPFEKALARVAKGAPARRGPGRPPKAAAAKKVRRARWGSKAKAATRAASKFSEGQKVTYKQGRGSFDAKVLKVDVATGMVTIQRVKDGKKVVRPAAKVKG